MVSTDEKVGVRAAEQGTISALRPRPSPSSLALRALLLIGVVFLLQMAKPLLLPVVIAVAFTFVLSSPVRRLRRLGIPEAGGAGIVVTAGLCVVVLAGSVLAEPAAEWWDRLPATVRQLADSADKLRVALLEATPVGTSRKPARPTAARPDPIAERLASEGVSVTRAVLGQALEFSVQAVATVILLYFLLASEHWLLSRTVEAVPRRRTRALVVGGVRQAQREIGLYLGTMALINLGLGAATAGAMAWLDLPNPLLWGAMAALLNFIPYLGPAIVFGFLVLAGHMAFGAGLGMLAPPLAFLAVHAIESNLVTPYVLGRRLRLAPLSVFLSVMFWGWLWGIVGAFVAVPILLGLRIVLRRNRRFKLACLYLEGDSSPAPSLRMLLHDKRTETRVRPADAAAPSRERITRSL